jgi:hypothetical protein
MPIAVIEIITDKILHQDRLYRLAIGLCVATTSLVGIEMLTIHWWGQDNNVDMIKLLVSAPILWATVVTVVNSSRDSRRTN